jgi:hypothetical protein
MERAILEVLEMALHGGSACLKLRLSCLNRLANIAYVLGRSGVNSLESVSGEGAGRFVAVAAYAADQSQISL